MDDQLDLFNQPPPEMARAHRAEDVTSRPYVPKDGPPEYQAAQELVHFTAYLKLNDWQKKVLWGHLQMLIERMAGITDKHLLYFELGYIISAMEIEQLRSRAAAREICEKYGVTF